MNDLLGIVVGLSVTMFFLTWMLCRHVQQLKNKVWEQDVMIQDLRDDLTNLSGYQPFQYKFEHRGDSHTAYRERTSQTVLTRTIVKNVEGIDKDVADSFTQQVKDQLAPGEEHI